LIARDKFAAKRRTAQPGRLPKPLPFVPQALAHPDVSPREAALLEGGESVDKPVPPVSAPAAVRVTRPTDVAPSDEIEKEITSLLKGLPRAPPSIATTSGNEEENSVAAQIQAAMVSLQRAPNKNRRA
jgi:hypothetical protein